jgi:carboxylesterase
VPLDPRDPLIQPLTVAARPELTGGRRIGVLLSHGFTGSPGSMRQWGEAMAEHGYGVEVPRLPGHGTSWRDCNRSTWEDWYGEVARVFDRLCLDHDAVVVGGLSMGGALTLRLAADHPDRVAGVVLVNPVVALGRPELKLLPLLKYVVPSVAGLPGDVKKAGVGESAYDRTPLRALHSMIRGLPALVADLPKMTAPLLYFRSTVDHVVDSLSEPLITGRVSSKEVAVRRLADSFHVATVDNDAPQIYAESVAFVARVTAP